MIGKEEALHRAVSILLRQDTYYWLKPAPYNGGADPNSEHPGFPNPSKEGRRTLDCTGFACWSAGMPRKRPDFLEYGGDINTTAMCLDAKNKRSVFSPLEEPVPGCFIVKPGKTVFGVKHVGHVGIVYDVKARLALDCSASNRPTAVNFSSFDKWGSEGRFLDWRPWVGK